MLFNFFKKTGMFILMLFFVYLIIGNLLHRFIFPEEKPEVTTWFKPGQILYSKVEGFKQTVVKQEAGKVYCKLEIEPFAPGPPKHIHTDFDETFEIEKGELTIWVNGNIRKIKAGEVLHIPKGTPHQPFNQTADTIHSKGSFSFPEKFAFSLAQIYGILDSQPDLMKTGKIGFYMPLFQASGFDSYLAEGPPVIVQKITGFIAAPMLRLLGYKSYYTEYDPINQK